MEELLIYTIWFTLPQGHGSRVRRNCLSGRVKQCIGLESYLQMLMRPTRQSGRHIYHMHNFQFLTILRQEMK